MQGFSKAAQPGPNGLLAPLVHELKTVLANVVHSSELFAEELIGPLSVQQREVAGILRENSHKLQLLVEYLAAYEGWRERTSNTDLVQLALRPMLERWVQRFRPIGASHDVRIELHCEDIQARVDSLPLGLMVDSLLAHSLQVSPSGGKVTVSAALERERKLVLEVADEGPRIEPGQAGSLFANSGHDLLIWKGNNPARSGLAVAQACARTMAGSLEITERDRGALFRVLLPADQLEMSHAR